MFQPEFLDLDDVLRMHAVQIDRFGGDTGLRDMGLLQSAIAQPRVTFGGQFLHADLFEMAAAYLYHIVQNHPFVDGNKRTGAVAANVFLDINGSRTRATNDELVKLVLGVAQGHASKPEIAEFFRRRAE